MTEVSLSFDHVRGREIAELLGEVGDVVVRDAHMRATTRTAEAARTQIRKEMSAETGVQAKLLNRRFRVHRGNRDRPDARLFIGTVPVRAYDMGVRELKRGVSVRGPGGRIRLNSAFVATMKSGRTGVFQRETKTRLPIKEVTVPIHYSARTSATRFLANRAKPEYEKVFQHEVNRRIGQQLERRGLR